MAKKKKNTYNPTSYVKAAKPANYTSAYANQINAARNQLLNFKYDPMQDASYQALAKIYGARGNIAAKDTLADAAALNGGFGTSYAVSAAQQARNQYNQELMALVPDLEQNAYNRLTTAYSTLQDADNTAYARYRDQVADYQWGKGYDTDVYQLKKSSAGSGSSGGGRRSSGGGGGYSGGSTSGMPDLSDEYNRLKNKGNGSAVISGSVNNQNAVTKDEQRSLRKKASGR